MAPRVSGPRASSAGCQISLPTPFVIPIILIGPPHPESDENEVAFLTCESNTTGGDSKQVSITLRTTEHPPCPWCAGEMILRAVGDKPSWAHIMGSHHRPSWYEFEGWHPEPNTATMSLLLR